MENMSYHSCRWCKWFQAGACTNAAMQATADDIHSFFEEGTLSEAIKEGFCEPKFPEFEMELAQTRLSVKAKHELLRTLYEELEAQKVNLVEAIDDSVSRALVACEFGSQIDIADPHSFYCKAFE